MSKEIKSLTGVRGIAALYVIIYHWHETLGKRGNDLPISNFKISVVSAIGHGYLSVDLFFVLSAFVLGLSSFRQFESNVGYKEFVRFMYKRFTRIFPLYISITILYYLFAHEATLTNLIINLTLLQGLSRSFNDSIIPPGWSLTNEWIIYFLVPIFFYLIARIKKRIWILPFTSLVIYFFLSLYRSESLNWYNYFKLKYVIGFEPILNYTRGPASLLRTIAAYSLGSFAFILCEDTKKPRIKGYFLIPIVILLFMERTDLLIVFLLPALIIYLTQENLTARFFASKPIYFLGLISYSLYVNHYLFIKIYNRKISFVDHFGPYFSLIFVLIGTCAFSSLTYYFIEKPGLVLLRQITKKGRTIFK